MIEGREITTAKNTQKEMEADMPRGRAVNGRFVFRPMG